MAGDRFLIRLFNDHHWIVVKSERSTDGDARWNVAHRRQTAGRIVGSSLRLWADDNKQRV
jgi:hypothetical protein